MHKHLIDIRVLVRPEVIYFESSCGVDNWRGSELGNHNLQSVTIAENYLLFILSVKVLMKEGPYSLFCRTVLRYRHSIFQPSFSVINGFISYFGYSLNNILLSVALPQFFFEEASLQSTGEKYMR